MSIHSEPHLRERGLKLDALEFIIKAEMTSAQVARRVAEQQRRTLSTAR